VRSVFASGCGPWSRNSVTCKSSAKLLGEGNGCIPLLRVGLTAAVVVDQATCESGVLTLGRSQVFCCLVAAAGADKFCIIMLEAGVVG
jgi:hypothetical protein